MGRCEVVAVAVCLNAKRQHVDDGARGATACWGMRHAYCVWTVAAWRPCGYPYCADAPATCCNVNRWRHH